MKIKIVALTSKNKKHTLKVKQWDESKKSHSLLAKDITGLFGCYKRKMRIKYRIPTKNISNKTKKRLVRIAHKSLRV